MKKQTFANRLSLRIMVVLIIISAIVMAIIYAITKDKELLEVSERAIQRFIDTNYWENYTLNDEWVLLIISSI